MDQEMVEMAMWLTCCRKSVGGVTTRVYWHLDGVMVAYGFHRASEPHTSVVHVNHHLLLHGGCARFTGDDAVFLLENG